MSRDGYRGPKLPKTLLEKVQSGGVSKNRRDISRKDRRKVERQAKRQSHRTQVRSDPVRSSRPSQYAAERASSSPEEPRTAPPEPARTQPPKDAQPVKSILKRKQLPPEPESEDDTDIEETDGPVIENESEGEASEDSFKVSRPTKRDLEEDDDEIASLEKKLGIKSKKSKVRQGDGLDWLADGSDGESGNDGLARPEDDEWLKRKRRKANSSSKADIEGSAEDEGFSGPSVDSGAEDDDFEGFMSEEEAKQDEPGSHPLKKQKENPYVAPPGPVNGISAPPAKYIPPSLRKPATSDEEMMRRLRTQIQGKVNKVAESNLISILREVEDIYKENARQHVTSTLIDILIGLITADIAHPDTVLITNAAFAAAVYKVVGTDFGAQLLEIIVERHAHFTGRKVGDGKQPLNLMAFLSYLYNFQVAGGGLLFDYVRILLQEVTEGNTEVLLRIMRISGQQLRQDDPSALKDIVMILQKLVAQTGEENLSVRTKFMIETMNNLKNNRVKTGLAASAIATEQTTRMKKTLGTLNSRAKATEPLRITLTDIQDTERKGKWWLIGASYHDPAKLASNTTTAPCAHDDSDTGYESTTPGSVNLTKLARKRGMNTDVRRAIFISLLSAADYKDAHARVMRLQLKNKQMLEIPRVMVSCVGDEGTYNPYYALVARRLCAGARDVRKAFQFTLWNFWREVEREEEGGLDDEDDAQGGDRVSVRRVVNLAKFYAALVADGSLSVAVLKKLDWNWLPSKESMFVEVFVTSVFFQLRRDAQKEAKLNFDGQGKGGEDLFQEKASRVFTCAGAREMVSGLKIFLTTTVENSDLARSKKEMTALREGCMIAGETLERSEKMAPVVEVESEGESEI